MKTVHSCQLPFQVSFPLAGTKIVLVRFRITDQHCTAPFLVFT